MMPVYWLLGAAALFLIEMITVSLTCIWFAGGAVIAAIGAYLGLPLVGQLAIFAAVSLVLLILTRPMAKKFVNSHLERTNADSFIGKKYRVTKRIDPANDEGAIRIGDVEWKAVPVDEKSVIPEGEIVIVREIRGNKLVVAEEDQTVIDVDDAVVIIDDAVEIVESDVETDSRDDADSFEDNMEDIVDEIIVEDEEE